LDNKWLRWSYQLHLDILDNNKRHHRTCWFDNHGLATRDQGISIDKNCGFGILNLSNEKVSYWINAFWNNTLIFHTEPTNETLAKYVCPVKPVGLKVDAANSTAIISWDKSILDEWKFDRRYLLNIYSQCLSYISTSHETEGHSLIIDKLWPGQNYSVELKAIGIESGLESPLIQIRFKTLPGAPFIVKSQFYFKDISSIYIIIDNCYLRGNIVNYNCITYDDLYISPSYNPSTEPFLAT